MKNNFPKISLLLSAILFSFFCLAFIFLYEKINANDQKLQEDTALWQTETSRREEIASLNNSLQQNTNDRAVLETHFAKSSDIVPFLDTIEKLGPKVGASAQVNSVDTTTDSQGLIVGLKASGSFEAIYKFLTLLENSPYELDFLSMDMHSLAPSDAVNAKNSQWEVTFKIKLLSFIP